MQRSARWFSIGLGVAISSWAVYAVVAWLRYGHPDRDSDEADPLLDGFMPAYDAAERHSALVNAPVDLAFAAATELDLRKSTIIRCLFKSRELLLGTAEARAVLPVALGEWARGLGWVVLAEIPGRELVFGAAARPWESKVVFRSVRPEEFKSFNRKDYAKIVWTLRADPIDSAHSIARTETRVVTTDREAFSRMRVYWACFSPGILLIRKIALRMVRREAERLSSRRALPRDPRPAC
jgi:hypothetical protein